MIAQQCRPDGCSSDEKMSRKAYRCRHGHVCDEPGEREVHPRTWDSPAEYEACCPRCGETDLVEGYVCAWCGEFHEELGALRNERCEACEKRAA